MRPTSGRARWKAASRRIRGAAVDQAPPRPTWLRGFFRPALQSERKVDMQYMILIYDDEKVWGAMKDASRDEMMASYFAYSKEMKEAGVMRAGDALQPTATATTVRLRQ